MRTDSYNGHSYALPREFLRDVTEVHPYRAGLEILGVWAQIVGLWWVGQRLWDSTWFWVGYAPLALLIAGRLGALLQLIHEGSHGLLFADKDKNQRAAKWLCALPIGVFFEGYASGHRRHHAYTNTEKDPVSDREKYRVTDFRDPKLYGLFLKDILGITALSIFFDYKKTEDDKEPSRLRSLPELCVVQAVLLFAGFQGDLLFYILFWIVPAISPHMFLMRIRGIAEHGLSKQLGKEAHAPSEGTFYI